MNPTPRLADHLTPFIRNEWYVAAESAEVGRRPMDRTLLGHGVLLYRKLDGSPVALRNRCPHRSFPLSKGTLKGDDVVCGYHGLQFGSNGRCERRAELRRRGYMPMPSRECAPVKYFSPALLAAGAPPLARRRGKRRSALPS
jgi:phenylpropionate dioxygenase-like ring-hydroxylating dioxygenase large terminal subunit